MTKIRIVLFALFTTLLWITVAWSLDLGDLFKKPKEPAPSEQSSQQSEPAKTKKGGGGLLGILEDTGVLDKKTSRIIRGAGETLQAMQPIGYDEELALGGSLAIEVFSRFGGPYPNRRLQKYINLVGQALVEVSDRPDIPYHFAVLNTEQPNAFATPGGYVFVSIGLMRMMKSEAELAGALGHEIAHITHRHALQTIERGKTLKGLTSLTTAILKEDPAKFNMIVDEMSNTLFAHGLDKNLEYEADQMGMEYAYRLGYHPIGLLGLLKKLAMSGDHGSIFFSTHPSPRDRYSQLVKPYRKYKDIKQAPRLAKRYAAWTKGQLQ
ncbi:MAG: M48 family metalloprotease [Nitrospinaceae bacterium]|nr:M48 family metalloprotease [Nitrospinaceae bacterium]NIR54247.1 M48 family metalloprotease [Nitrospinaceae bacterium]NIS84664.1 M48 family metalloprotease [Nitrospinaceae bacterium]NIT81459.1 M48 family metalloprotease [Nitrospinaceae bacterium]NIU43743.1 M48 family metalloprotease [Nitrospinaceae bacterium]